MTAEANAAPPFSYSWSNGSSAAEITNLSSGIPYTVTVTAIGNCTSTASATLTSPQSLNITEEEVRPDCKDGKGGSINIAVTGSNSPFTYAWSNDSTMQDIGALSAGTYTVTVTNSKGCSITQTFSVPGVSTPLAVQLDNTAVSCYGLSDGQIAATISGGSPPFSFQWSNTPLDTNIVNNLARGTYTVTVQDSIGCAVVQTATVEQPDTLVAVLDITQLRCHGDSDGKITAMITGGTPSYDYTWGDMQTGASRTNLGAGTYVLTVTDRNMCTATAVATISNPPALAISDPVVKAVNCFEGNDGSITFSASGGTGTLNFSWSDQPSLNTNQRMNLTAGTYTVTVTDANSCTSTRSFPVNQPTAPLSVMLSKMDPTACTGSGATGSITLFPAGGTAPYNYVWSPMVGKLDGDKIDSLPPGIYSLTITDFLNCTKTISVTLSSPNSPSLALFAQTASKCNDVTGTVTLTVSGGTGPFVVWKNDQQLPGPNPAGPSIPIGQLGAGTYTFSVVDQNNCSSVVAVTISNFPPPTIGTITSTKPFCGQSNGTITVAGNLSYTYAWSNGQSGLVLNSLPGGPYTLTVTDPSTNCTATASQMLTPETNLSSLVIITGPSSVCQNDPATLTAPLYPSWQYAWAPGNGTAQTFAPPTGAAGSTTYTLTVSVPGIPGCTGTGSFPLLVKPRPAPTGSAVDLCVGNPVDLASTTLLPPGATYLWSTGATTSTLQKVNSAGTYTVTVTLDGCSASATFTVTKKGDWPLTDTIIHKSPNRNHILVCPDSTLCYQWGYIDALGNPIDSPNETKQYWFLGQTFVPNRRYYVKIRKKTSTGCDACERLIERTLDDQLVDLPLVRSAQVFPNPGMGHFQAKVLQPEPEALVLEVYDMLGRSALPTIPISAVPETVESFDLSRAPAGAYYWVLRHPNGDILERQTLILLH